MQITPKKLSHALIVENDTITTLIVSLVLKRFNPQVKLEIAKDGMQAIKYLRENPFPNSLFLMYICPEWMVLNF